MGDLKAALGELKSLTGRIGMRVSAAFRAYDGAERVDCSTCKHKAFPDFDCGPCEGCIGTTSARANWQPKLPEKSCGTCVRYGDRPHSVCMACGDYGRWQPRDQPKRPKKDCKMCRYHGDCNAWRADKPCWKPREQPKPKPKLPEKCCATCRHENLRGSSKPCADCEGEVDNWQPKLPEKCCETCWWWGGVPHSHCTGGHASYHEYHGSECDDWKPREQPTPAYKMEAGCMVAFSQRGGESAVWRTVEYVNKETIITADGATISRQRFGPALRVAAPATPEVGDVVEVRRDDCTEVGIISRVEPCVVRVLDSCGSIMLDVRRDEFTILRKANQEKGE